MNSIRGQLLLWQIGSLVLVTALVSLITYEVAWNGFNRMRDHALEQIAHSIVSHGADATPLGAEPDQPGDILTQTWDSSGQLRYSSHPALNLPRQAPGLHSVEWLGDTWHVFAISRNGVVTQVANSTTNRRLMFADTSIWLLIPAAVLVGVLGGMFWLGTGEVLDPLRAIRSELGKRSPNSLEALPASSFPSEIAPMVETLNALLTRLDHALASQARFVADAAHELRTPLTAIKLQTQVALASGRQQVDREALEMLAVSVDRASHLVSQLLLLARIESGAQASPRGAVQLDTLVRQVVAEQSVIADSRDIDLGVGACAALQIEGHAEGLRALLGNLVDNALRYGRPGGRVDVELALDGDAAVLTVSDDGPGIPAAARERAFERFHRLAGAETPGSGLGLAIVKEVAESHGGRVTLDDGSAGGLSVRVRFPGASLTRA
ncbi:MAG: two-component sensor histidine kinase [Sulfuritalea sp.]|nr:two-component sensor histidine kinase [Sulfuritalea sp.]